MTLAPPTHPAGEYSPASTGDPIMFGSQPTGIGSVVATSPSRRLSRGRVLKVGRLVLVVSLVAGLATVATILVRTQSSLQSTRAGLASSQVSLKSAQDSLKGTQAQLRDSQSRLVVQTQISEYAGAFVQGSQTFGHKGALDPCLAQNVIVADCEAALDKEAAAANAFGARLSGLAVPAPLSNADQETRHGLQLLATGFTQMRAAAANHDWTSFNAGVDLANQGNAFLNDGWDQVLNVLSANTNA